MTTITKQTIYLDLTPGRVFPVLHVSQGDTGLEALEFKLVQNGMVFNIPAAVTDIQINGTTPLGVFSYNHASGVNWSGNTVTAAVTQTMTEEAGMVVAELVLLDSAMHSLGSLNFLLSVEPSPYTGAHVSVSDLASISASLNAAQQNFLMSKSWAVGDTGLRDGEATNNSKYWSEQSAINGERWAVGKINGENVPSTDETYENNSKYWAGVAEDEKELAAQYGSGLKAQVDTNSARITQEVNDRSAAVSSEASTRAAAISSEASARAAAISSEASTRASADSNLQSQINKIIAPSGEAPSAAEVQNARIGADGVTYDTLGTAIRTQVGALKDDIANIYNGTRYFKRIDDSIEWINNKYWQTDTNVAMDGNGFSYAKTECSKGTKIQYTGTGLKIANAVAFTDADGNILKKSDETENHYYNSAIFIAPTNTAYVIFNNAYSVDNRYPLILMDAEIEFIPEFADKISKNYGMTENLSSLMAWKELSLNKVTDSYFETWHRGFVSNTGFEYTIIQAKAGDRFKYSGKCGEGFRCASFRDENGNVLGSTPEIIDTTYTDLIITAPYGTYDIVFNANSASNMQISKLEVPKIFKEIPLKKSPKLFVEDKYVDYIGTGFQSAEVDAKQGDTFIYVNGYSEPSWRAVYFVDKDYNVLDKSNETDKSVRKNIIMTAPYGTVKAIFNNNAATQNKLIVRKEIPTTDKASFWKGKKIVWFGTSIPAGTQEWNYPFEVGELQGSIVYNEAVGASCARAGCKSKITSDDPYGWTGANFYNVAYGLSGTLSEKNELINNFSKWKTLLEGCPDTLSDSEKQKILNCSYENKLDKYLSNGSVGTMDLYVFDHGYNDNWFYNASINQMDVIPDNNMDRYYYIGAMNFLINRILEDNPKAVICFIGHYEADRKETSIVTKAQQVLADYWRFPFIETWKYLPFTERNVQANGYWQMSSGIGTWVEDDKQHLMTMREVWLADGLHPYSDGSGKATLKYANLLANFLNENVN